MSVSNMIQCVAAISKLQVPWSAVSMNKLPRMFTELSCNFSYHSSGISIE